MSRVVISRIATVTALGDGLDQLWQRLLHGDSGISPLSRFSCENYISRYAACIEALQTSKDASLQDSILARVATQMPDIPGDSRFLVASTKGEIDRLTATCRRGMLSLSLYCLSPLRLKLPAILVCRQRVAISMRHVLHRRLLSPGQQQ